MDNQLIVDILSGIHSYLSYKFQKYILNKKWNIPFSPEVTQNFSLPENIVYHLRRNATNHLVLTNLQRSCKYFGSYYKVVELKDLHFGRKPGSLIPITNVSVNKRKMKTTDEELLTRPVHYVFTGKFQLVRPSMPLLISKLLSKALISNVSKIYLIRQILTFEEFKFLTVNTSRMTLHGCQIFDENKEVVSAPRLIPWDSDFEDFDFASGNPAYFPREAFQEMASKTINNLSKKKVYLNFWFLPPDFDPTLLVEFLMNNRSENLIMRLIFDPTNDQIARNMKEFVDEKLKDLPKEKKPKVIIH